MLRVTKCWRLADVLSGVALSQEIRRRVGTEVQLLSRPPCLAVVLVGERADSHRYVRHKQRAAAECGIAYRLIQLSETISQTQLHKALVAVNSNASVDGVLLQLPLPAHLRARPALFHIHPGKDVDGLHPLNAGNLFLRDASPLADVLAASERGAINADTTESSAKAKVPMDQSIVVSDGKGAFSSIPRRSHEHRYFIPCTAMAVRTLIVSYLNQADTFFHGTGGPSSSKDLHAVIVNTSMVVGVPTAALLQKERGFSVTMCNRNCSVEQLRRLTRTADVLVTACGQANLFDASFVKDGAIVVDVAINERPKGCAGSDQSPPRKTLCGDVDYESVRQVARAVTPVPGGVGPLTVAHLMQNVLKAARLRHDTRLYYNNIYTSFVGMYGGGGCAVASLEKMAAGASSPSSSASSPIPPLPLQSIQQTQQPQASTNQHDPQSHSQGMASAHQKTAAAAETGTVHSPDDSHRADDDEEDFTDNDSYGC